MKNLKCPQCHKKTLKKSQFESGKYACSTCHEWFDTKEVMREEPLVHTK